MSDIAIVLGVSASNGLGAAIARRFASGGLHVVVAGRTEQRLAIIVEEIRVQGGDASLCVTDATDAAAVDDLMARANSLGTLKSVVFNVGNNQPLAFSDLSAEQFEQFWRTCTLSGFLAAKASLPTLEANAGSLLFTGASASMRGRPGFAHFSAAKAGLRNMAQALAKEYGPKGVHVGHVWSMASSTAKWCRTALVTTLTALAKTGPWPPTLLPMPTGSCIPSPGTRGPSNWMCAHSRRTGKFLLLPEK